MDAFHLSKRRNHLNDFTVLTIAHDFQQINPLGCILNTNIKITFCKEMQYLSPNFLSKIRYYIYLTSYQALAMTA